MRKLIFPLLAAVVTAFTACNNKSEHTFNVLGFYPIGRDIIVYADQALDTTYQIAATQDWQVASSTPWLTVTPTSGKVAQGKVAEVKLSLATTPNTTNQLREGLLTLSSSLGNVIKPFKQLSLLHLPNLTPIREENTWLYSQHIDKDTTHNNVTLRLRLYTTTVKVRSDSAWVHVADTTTYTTQDSTITVKFDRNTTAKQRHAYITLYTPEGITTRVRFVQAQQP